MLKLQLQIQNLRAPFGNTTIGLQDICFQPMSPDVKDCAIQSVLNYYQNSAEALDRVAMDTFGLFQLADYLDHFLYCVKSVSRLRDHVNPHKHCFSLLSCCLRLHCVWQSSCFTSRQPCRICGGGVLLMPERCDILCRKLSAFYV